MGFIYSITNRVNGKRYIGCTFRPIAKRWDEHARAAARGSAYAIHGAIRKYGKENFSVEVIETVRGSHKELMATEVACIVMYNTLTPGGYNLTPGGDGVDLTVPETYARYSRAHAEAMRKLPSDPKWVARHGAAMKEVAQRPAWVEKRGSLEFHSSPIWHKNVSDSNQKKASDPEWIKTTTEANRRTASIPNWRKSRKSACTKAREANIARARERDRQCTPKERAKRIRLREASLRYSQKKRAKESLSEGGAQHA